jgi:hypothetical protein
MRQPPLPYLTADNLSSPSCRPATFFEKWIFQDGGVGLSFYEGLPWSHRYRHEGAANQDPPPLSMQGLGRELVPLLVATGRLVGDG